MCYLPRLFILAFCFAMAASVGLAQAPGGKPPDSRKGASKAAPADAAFVDAFVARMMAFDKNKDGKLTREEITDQRLLRLFDRADTNKDGVVTREELVALANELAAEQGQDGGGRGGPGGGPRGGPGGFGPPGGRGPKGPGGFGGPSQPGQILSPMMERTLKLTDSQKEELKTLQSEVDAGLEKILTNEQKKQLKDLRNRGPGGPDGPGGPRPPGPPPGPPDETSQQPIKRPVVLGKLID